MFCVYLFLALRPITSGVDVVVSVTDVKLIDCLFCGSQWFDRLSPKIGKQNPLTVIGRGLQKGHSAGVSQPAPMADGRTFLCRTPTSHTGGGGSAPSGLFRNFSAS